LVIPLSACLIKSVAHIVHRKGEVNTLASELIVPGEKTLTASMPPAKHAGPEPFQENRG